MSLNASSNSDGEKTACHKINRTHLTYIWRHWQYVIMLSTTFLLLFEFFEKVGMTVGEMLCQVGRVGSLGLRRLKNIFYRRALGCPWACPNYQLWKWNNATFTLCVFVDKLWTACKSTCICSHASRFVTMKGAACMREKKESWNAHYAFRQWKQSAAHAAVAHQFKSGNMVLNKHAFILIVPFVIVGYCNTFLVLVYCASLSTAWCFS